MYKHPEQRVGVFIDTANMYHSAKNLYKANVNFGEVLRAAVADRKLVRAIAYVIRSSNDEENTFFDALSKQGFEVKQKDLQVFASGMKKADWDVGLAVDCIKLADRLDAIVIVSGDGDYIPLAQYLRENRGCLVEVAAFSETTSGKLRELADDFIDLSADPERFLMGWRGAARNSKRRAPAERGERNDRSERSDRVERPERTERAAKPLSLDDDFSLDEAPVIKAKPAARESAAPATPKRKRRVIF